MVETTGEASRRGEFSMAAVQSYQDIEDHSQVDVGEDALFVGVYDGHKGVDAARYIRTHALKALLSESFFDQFIDFAFIFCILCFFLVCIFIHVYRFCYYLIITLCIDYAVNYYLDGHYY